ncbi:MAG TPA: DUF5995 family protein [Mycolicibacillus parakoreensis]|nr:DUF5995 family protein [Mycolicibacillus parakoreensis]
MTTMLLRQPVAAAPAVVWESLTDPGQMNAWSTARIELVGFGDRQRADGVGAMRRVYLPYSGLPLTEVIHASEPPYHLGYTVVGGVPLLREHTGRITVTPAGGDAAEIRWEVVMRFEAPGLATVAARLIEGELRRSLRRLAELAPRPAGAVPTPRRLAQGDLSALRDTAERVLVEQRAVADRLAHADDPKQWFARVYQYVTEEQLAHLHSGLADNPEWILRLIPCFHELYLSNLVAFERGEAVEKPWHRAWGQAERAAAAGSPKGIVEALLLGVAAHIEADLPRALSTTYLDHFRHRCDYTYFRADYLRMSAIFRLASERLISTLPRRCKPVWVPLAQAVLPAELRYQLMCEFYYNIPRKRLDAFERGRRLAQRHTEARAPLSAQPA